MASSVKVKKILRASFVILTVVGFVAYLFLVEGRGSIRRVFSNLKWEWLAIATGAWCLSALAFDSSLSLIRRHYQRRFPFWYVLLNTRKASFYEMLTPGTFAFGPIIQVNSMSKQGVPISKGASIILLQQTCTVMSYIVCSLIFVFADFGFFAAKMSVGMWLVYALALMTSVLIMAVYMLVPRKDNWIIAVAGFLIGLLFKMHIIGRERKERMMAKTSDQVTKLKNNMKSLDFTLFEWVRSVAILVLDKAILYSVHYFIALSLGVDVRGALVHIIAANSIALIISNQIAIPGGFGIFEVSYYAFMLSIIGSESAMNFMMLLNRIVTYYFPLLIGGLAHVIRNPGITDKVDVVVDSGIENDSADSNRIDNMPSEVER